MRIQSIASGVAVMLALTGCSTISNLLPGGDKKPVVPAAVPSGQAPGTGYPGAVIAMPQQQMPGRGPSVAAPTTLSAVGYGSPGSYSQYSSGQQRLMAMRAAQVDAYRNLAEQVYGFRVFGNTSVSAFATQSDTIRSFVDSFIRGARVVSTVSVADGNFEVTVELPISHQFIDCLSNTAECFPQRAMMPPPNACPPGGCLGSSATYISP